MAWIVPDREVLATEIINSHRLLYDLLFEKDVYLFGGANWADNIRVSSADWNDKTKIYVQLNHHLTRRYHQPCDWLIARAGSGMDLEKFNRLAKQTRERIKVISCACNKHTFNEFVGVRPVFPFHEIGYIKENPFHPSLEWCNAFWNEIKTNPLIGILAIKMILMFPIKSLTLRGFDFFAKPDGTQRDRLSCHHLGLQRAWLLERYRTDFRLNFDADTRLKEALGIDERFLRGIDRPISEQNNSGRQ